MGPEIPIARPGLSAFVIHLTQFGVLRAFSVHTPYLIRHAGSVGHKEFLLIYRNLTVTIHEENRGL